MERILGGWLQVLSSGESICLQQKNHQSPGAPWPGIPEGEASGSSSVPLRPHSWGQRLWLKHPSLSMESKSQPWETQECEDHRHGSLKAAIPDPAPGVTTARNDRSQTSPAPKLWQELLQEHQTRLPVPTPSSFAQDSSEVNSSKFQDAAHSNWHITSTRSWHILASLKLLLCQVCFITEPK